MEKWKQLGREYIINNKWVKLAKDKVLLPNGHSMDDFYVFEKKNVSIIVAMHEDNNVPFEEAIDMCISNKIKVNGTIAGLLLAEKCIAK